MNREPLQIRYVHYGAVPPVPALMETGRTYRPDRNIIAACEIAGISVAEARSPNRSREVAYKRFHVMAIMRSWGRSLSQIGRLLNRDHSTVLHGLRKWEVIDSDMEAYFKRPEGIAERYVNWNAKRGKWIVRLWGYDGLFVGAFSEFGEAVKARDAALAVAASNNSEAV